MKQRHKTNERANKRNVVIISVCVRMVLFSVALCECPIHVQICWCFYGRLEFIQHVATFSKDLEDWLHRIEIILIQQPGLTANIKDLKQQLHQLEV